MDYSGRPKVHLWDDVDGYTTFPYKKYAYKKSSNGTAVSLYGDKLQRVTQWNKTDKDLFESDVSPATRVLIDTYMADDEPSTGHTVVALDIEVEVTDGFPYPEIASDRINAITLCDMAADKYYTVVLDEHNRIHDSQTENESIEVFDTEKDLLHRFYQIYDELAPTILTGWNIDGFDIPYIYNRSLQVVDHEIANSLSPIGIVEWNDFKGGYKIAGVSCLDYLKLYKNFTFSQLSSYRLDAVGQHEKVGQKIEYDGTLVTLYEDDIEKFVEYNIHDVRLIKLLDDKLNFIEIARGTCHLGHVPYEDVYFSSRFLEGAMLVYLKRHGIVAPNRVANDNEDSHFAGAYIQPPQKGRWDWIYDLDLTSMYPSIIMSLNISPETKVGYVKNWDTGNFVGDTEAIYDVKYKTAAMQHLSSDELKTFFKRTPCSISSNGILYKTTKRGLVPSLLVDWFESRVEFRKLAKKYADAGDNVKYDYFNRRQHIQKILLNSLYGTLGLPGFRFYDLDNALAVTATGVDLIKFSKKIANHYYNDTLGTDKDYVIYVDTDSLFLSSVPLIKHKFPKKKMNDVLMAENIRLIAGEVQAYINNSYNYFAQRFCNVRGTHRFEIKQELIAKSGFFVTKKRYGLRIINDNGVKVDKLEVKGLDTVRSNFPSAFRGNLQNILEDILANVPKDKIDERIIDFKDGVEFLPVDDIAGPTGVKTLKKYQNAKGGLFHKYKKGTPIHVKSALAYNDLLVHMNIGGSYLPIRGGDKIKVVYLKDNIFKINSLAYKGYEDPKEILTFLNEYIDYGKMYEKLLNGKIQKLYDALDWDMPQNKKYTLDRFF